MANANRIGKIPIRRPPPPVTGPQCAAQEQVADPLAAVRDLADRLHWEELQRSAPTKIRAGAQGSVSQKEYNGQDVAEKVFNYTARPDAAKAIIDLQREYESLKSLPHPSIIRFMNFEHIPAENLARLLMEWASTTLSKYGQAVDLGDVICHHDGQHELPKEFLPEEFVWHVLFHLGSALALCHHGVELLRETQTEHIDCAEVLEKMIRCPQVALQQLSEEKRKISCTTERMWFSLRPDHEPIIHRDIKPRNVLLKDPHMKPNDEDWRADVTLDASDRLCVQPIVLLGDFGLSAPLRDARTVGIGSPGFTAPEVPYLPSRPDSDAFVWTTSCDIFSVGATVWNLMALQSPPYHFESSKGFGDLPRHYSAPLRELVHACLSKKPDDRPTALHIVTACITRACWNDTYVSPYGVLIGSYFHAKVIRSWNRTLRKLNRPNLTLAQEWQLPESVDDTVTLQEPLGPGKKGPMAKFVQNAYRMNYFNRKRPFDVPKSRNQKFTGCQAILQTLLDKFETPRHDQLQTRMALTGGGGVGKSEIAREFAYQLRDYDPNIAIYWVNGETSGQVQASYRRIATSLGLMPSDDPSTDVVHWLEGNESGRWIMIVDSIVCGKVTTRAFPARSKGALLFTTRDPKSITDHFRDVELLEVVSSQLGDDIGEVSPSTEMIVTRFGVSPSTLSQVAGLFRSVGDWEYEDPVREPEDLALQYSSRCSRIISANTDTVIPRESQELMKLLEPYIKPQSTFLQKNVHLPFPKSLVSVLDKAFDKLSDAAKDLLSKISFLDSDNIPIWLLAEEFENKFDLLQAILSLRDNSMIVSVQNDTDTEDQRFCVLWLVQKYVRDRLDENMVQKFTLSAFRLVAKKFPDDPFNEWQMCAELLPHAERLLEIPSEGLTHEAQITRAELLERTGAYLVELGMLKSAKSKARVAAETRGKFQGKYHPATLRSLEKLARTLVICGDCKEAISLLEHVLHVTKHPILTNMGDVDIHMDALGDLAFAYQKSGKYSDAFQLINEQMRMWETQNRPKSVVILSAHESLGMVLKKLHRSREAEVQHDVALAGLQELLGLDHPKTWICLSNRASCQQHVEKYSEAVVGQREAFVSLERLLGARNPSTLRSAIRLANALVYKHIFSGDATELEEAVTLYNESLDALRTIYGQGHPDTFECKAGLSSAYSRLGKFEEAENTISEALSDSMGALGPNHPQTLSVMEKQAKQLERHGKLESAQVVLQDVYTRRKQLLGSKHPDTVDTACELAMLYNQRRGRPAFSWLDGAKSTTSQQ